MESRVGRVSLTPGFPGVHPSPIQSIPQKAYCHSQLQLNSFSKPQGMTPVVCVGSVARALVLQFLARAHHQESGVQTPTLALRLPGYYDRVMALSAQSSWYPHTATVRSKGRVCNRPVPSAWVCWLAQTLSQPQLSLGAPATPILLEKWNVVGKLGTFYHHSGGKKLDGKKITFAGNG